MRWGQVTVAGETLFLSLPFPASIMSFVVAHTPDRCNNLPVYAHWWSVLCCSVAVSSSAGALSLSSRSLQTSEHLSFGAHCLTPCAKRLTAPLMNELKDFLQNSSCRNQRSKSSLGFQFLGPLSKETLVRWSWVQRCLETSSSLLFRLTACICMYHHDNCLPTVCLISGRKKRGKRGCG